MSEAHDLPRPLRAILLNLYEAGGAGTLDMHSNVRVGRTQHPLPGDPGAWLKLVAAGLLAGERGQIIITEQGRAECRSLLEARTRQA